MNPPNGSPPTGFTGWLLAAPVQVQPVGDGALSTRAHVFVVVVTLLSIVFIVRLVRRHQLRTKYSLLWVTVALVLASVAIFPGMLASVSRAAGVFYPPATFLLLAVGFLFLIVVHFSWELSRSEERIRTLAEEAALLRASHEELAERVSDLEGREPRTTATREPGSTSGDP
jgi:hypothetical protein